METLGDLLPKKQAKMLTDKVRSMTKKDLEREANSHPRSNLSYHDIDGLRSVALHRINKGDTVFTFENHNFNSKDKDAQDPSTCSCI